LEVKRDRPGRRLTPEEHRERGDKAAQLFGEGKPMKEIGDEVATNLLRVRRYLRERELPSAHFTKRLGDEKSFLTSAAKACDVNRDMLRLAIAEGRVQALPFERPGLGRDGIGYVVDLDHLRARLDELRCPTCDKPALGSSGGCMAHGHALLAEGQPRAPEIIEKMWTGRCKSIYTRTGSTAIYARFATHLAQLRRELDPDHRLPGNQPLDEVEARQAAAHALELYRQDQGQKVSRPKVVSYVVVRTEGKAHEFHPDGRRRDARDPVRRAAEKRIVRRLETAAELPDLAATRLARDFARGV
jgi:hypothetical protein